MNKTESVENFVYLVGLRIYYKMIHGPYSVKSLKLVIVSGLLGHFSSCDSYDSLKCTPNITAMTKSKEGEKWARCLPRVWEKTHSYRIVVRKLEKTIRMN